MKIVQILIFSILTATAAYGTPSPGMTPCGFELAFALLRPPSPYAPLNHRLEPEIAQKMLLENIDDDAPNSFFYKHLLERMRDLSVIVPGMKQHERVEVFEYFAKLYQSIEKKEKYFSNEKEYQQDLRVGYAWGYVKKTSSNNIVYFVAANGKGSLLYMPDGTVHFAANNTDKDFYPHMPGAELPTSLDDTKFLYTYPVVPRVSDL